MEWQYGIDELNSVALEVWSLCSEYNVWALHGDMGVGKTTFVHTLCHDILEASDNVSSPTFSIINQYQGTKIGDICHIDLYRLNDIEEAINAGVEDAIVSARLSLVEWPEKATELFEENTVHLYFELLPNGNRQLKVSV